MRNCYAIVFAGAALATGTIIQADTVFDNQADFFAAVGAVVTEDFESYTPGDPSGGAVSFMDFGTFSATSDPAALKILSGDFFGNHNTTPGGSQYLSADTDIGGVSADVTLTFDEPVFAFGLYLVDAEDGGFIHIGNDFHPFAGGPDGVETYFGIISDTPFTTITIDAGDTDSHWSMDDVSYAVPAPGSIAALLIGLGSIRRRR